MRLFKRASKNAHIIQGWKLDSDMLYELSIENGNSDLLMEDYEEVLLQIEPIVMKEINSLQLELTKLRQQNEVLRDSYKEGVRDCINALRSLQGQFRHQSRWNHSGQTKFAPVELSDYLLTEVLSKPRKCLEEIERMG